MILTLNKVGGADIRHSRARHARGHRLERGLRPCQRPDRDVRPHRAVHRDARHHGHFPLARHLARGRRDHHDAQSRNCANSTARSISATCSASRFPSSSFLSVAAIGALILYKTSFGRHVVALGSNEDVARYSGVPIWRVRTLTYVIQGICVGIAVLVYVPRLGSATPTTGLLWELQAITAVVVGGTALKGGIGRIWRHGYRSHHPGTRRQHHGAVELRLRVSRRRGAGRHHHCRHAGAARSASRAVKPGEPTGKRIGARPTLQGGIA